jgi:redox-sensitive bicupin YhaK (pirin superfamily)
MNNILHKAEERGRTKIDWLDSYHTFSFGNYYNTSRIRFGALRVINDDIIQVGQGFGMHPHQNMEIITIPFEGVIEHKDSAGHSSLIKPGDLQFMSAGSGIYHSEYNHLQTGITSLLQIWVFPRENNLTPSYDQITFNPDDFKNNFHLVVSPQEIHGKLKINQDAYFSIGHFDTGMKINYPLYLQTNGLYIFVIEGSIETAGIQLGRRDGLGITATSQAEIQTLTDAKVLLMEVPA